MCSCQMCLHSWIYRGVVTLNTLTKLKVELALIYFKFVQQRLQLLHIIIIIIITDVIFIIYVGTITRLPCSITLRNLVRIGAKNLSTMLPFLCFTSQVFCQQLEICTVYGLMNILCKIKGVSLISPCRQ